MSHVPSSRSTAANILDLYAEHVTGKTAIVTGCTAGIGKETVLQLLAHGVQVVMACRSAEKMEQFSAEAIASFPEGKLHSLKLDLASLASVRDFCTNFKQLDLPLDILICNAGVMACPRMLTEDGLEMQLGTNHFGHMYLTLLLKDKLIESKPSRVVCVSSMAHHYSYSGGIKLDDLNQEHGYSRWNAYGQSKLANILFAKELNRRLSEHGVTAFSLHPGVIATELQRNLGVLGSIFNFLSRPFGKNIPQGAATTVFCAAAPLDSLVPGGFHSDCAPQAPSALGRNDELARALWDKSMGVFVEKDLLPPDFAI